MPNYGYGASPSSQFSPLDTIRTQLMANFHILIIIAVVVYFGVQYAFNRRPSPTDPAAMMRNVEAMQEARRRQMDSAKEALAEDARREKERHERSLEEQRLSRDTRNGIHEEIPLLRKAQKQQPSQKPLPPPRPRWEDEDSDNNPRPLPKLSGGDRAEWERNQSQSTGGDRTNRFKRDCGPRGG